MPALVQPKQRPSCSIIRQPNDKANLTKPPRRLSHAGRAAIQPSRWLSKIHLQPLAGIFIHMKQNCQGFISIISIPTSYQCPGSTAVPPRINALGLQGLRAHSPVAPRKPVRGAQLFHFSVAPAPHLSELILPVTAFGNGMTGAGT